MKVVCVYFINQTRYYSDMVVQLGPSDWGASSSGKFVEAFYFDKMPL